MLIVRKGETEGIGNNDYNAFWLSAIWGLGDVGLAAVDGGQGAEGFIVMHYRALEAVGARHSDGCGCVSPVVKVVLRFVRRPCCSD